MNTTYERSELNAENGSAVLMARIVDHAGRCIRPIDVAMVTVSIRELNRDKPPKRSVRFHHRCMLRASDVLFDLLQTDRAWDIDAVGYNFRHKIPTVGDGAFPNPEACYEICYTLLPRGASEPVNIRFYVRNKPQ